MRGKCRPDSSGLLEKGRTDLLPCAGITLIRFTGMISDCPVMLNLSRHRRANTPGTLKVSDTSVSDTNTRTTAKLRVKNSLQRCNFYTLTFVPQQNHFVYEKAFLVSFDHDNCLLHHNGAENN